MKTIEEIRTLGWMLTGYEKGPAKGKMSPYLADILREAESVEDAIRNLTNDELIVTLCESGDFTRALHSMEYNALVVKWIADWNGFREDGACYNYAFTPRRWNVTED